MIQFPKEVQLLQLAHRLTVVATERRTYAATIEGSYRRMLCDHRPHDAIAQGDVEGGCDWRDLEARR